MARHASKTQSTRHARRKAAYTVMDDNVLAMEPNKTMRHPPTRKPSISYRTEVQGHYHLAMGSHVVTFGIGPAGTGKSYLAALEGARLLDAKRIRQLIITRPAVEAGESLGFLPGTEAEKIDPYFAPIRSLLTDYFGQSHLALLLKREQVVFAPMGFLRGVTFEDAFVILDEAQNTTPTQMKLFLSRIGEHCTVVVNGDVDQKDIPGQSGLNDAQYRLQGLPGVAFIEFTEEDIVRSPFVKALMKRYRSTSSR